MAFQLELGESAVVTPDIPRDVWEAVAANPTLHHVARFLRAQAVATTVSMREMIRGDLIHQARIHEGYIQALDDVAKLLSQGIEQALNDPENK